MIFFSQLINMEKYILFVIDMVFSKFILDLGIYMRVTAPLIIIFLVCLKSVLICQGGITFYTRDCIIMLTLFKSIVLSRLDYGSQAISDQTYNSTREDTTVIYYRDE